MRTLSSIEHERMRAADTLMRAAQHAEDVARILAGTTTHAYRLGIVEGLRRAAAIVHSGASFHDYVAGAVADRLASETARNDAT